MEDFERLSIIKRAYNDKDFYSLLIGEIRYKNAEDDPFLVKYFNDGWRTPKLQKVDYYKLLSFIKKLVFKEEIDKEQTIDLMISAAKKLLDENSFEKNAYALLFLFALLCQKGKNDYFVFTRAIRSIEELIEKPVNLSRYFPLNIDQKELYQLLLIEEKKQRYYTNTKYFNE